MITKPKGTYDLYGKEGRKVLFLQSLINDLMHKYNFEYVRTPIFEMSELFHRGVGETTDIVTKETYDFKDRGDRSLTLRPEGTAGIARFFIENKLHTSLVLPKKFYYFGPMFRYERPQSGRYRQHHQFGLEALGSADPMMDAEVISIPYTLFKLLGLQGVKVNINSLGDDASRANYKQALIKYLEPNIDKLCDDCKARFLKNPLRILDCKKDQDSDILKNTPKTIDYLNEESKKFFDDVLKYLDVLGIEYEVNPKTVRGLDYYTHTVFEIEAQVEGFGSQNVMCGGGRYNNLIKNLGGVDTPAVGFGMGIERLLTALEFEGIELVDEDSLDAYVIAVTNKEKDYAFSIAQTLRLLGFRIDMDYLDKNLKTNLTKAERMNARFALIIGEEEVKNEYITVRNMETKDEKQVEVQFLVDFLEQNLMLDAYDECDCGCEGEHSHDDCCCNDTCDCDDECCCSEDDKCNDNCTCDE